MKRLKVANNGRTPEVVKVWGDGHNVALYAADFCGEETQVILNPDEARKVACWLDRAARKAERSYGW